MTGFARVRGAGRGFDWIWEAKSVNSRGFDMRLRLPPALSHLEPEVRARASERFARGRIEMGLAIRSESRAPRYEIDRELLAKLRTEIENSCGAGPAVSDVATLLAVRGVVVETAADGFDDEAQLQERDRLILDDFGKAADALFDARRDEGLRLHATLIRHIDDMEDLVREARGIIEAMPLRIEEHVKAQIGRLSEEAGQISAERLTQEVAMILVRGDVREEIDRIGAHIEAARELLAADGAKGRKLDFLCQEFNREATTLCAKSSALPLTRTGLELKAVIDRVREQSQNIE